MNYPEKIAFGGGCNWCTEAVFQSVIGVSKVEQGYVASIDNNSSFSEAVIVYFDNSKIALKTLIEIHLHTHKSTSNHIMRSKYRSAIYTFSDVQIKKVQSELELFQFQFQNNLITKVLPFNAFKASRKQIQNYYYTNPEKPFCEMFINPKLTLLLNKFSNDADQKKLKHLKDKLKETQNPKYHGS
jgi:peptide-methionine (S)-S-oxide reductase